MKALLKVKCSMLMAMLIVAITFVSPAYAVLLHGIETNNDNLFTIDTVTGTVNTVGGLGLSWGLGGVAFNSNTLYGMNTSDNSLYTINTGNGLATFVGSTGIFPLESLAIINGIGYSQDVFTNNLYSINLGTGMATLIGNYVGGRVTGLTTDGTSLYGTRIGEQDLVKLNIGTGAIDSIIGVHGLGSDTSLAWATGSFWTIPAFSATLYSLNPANAVATLEFAGLGLGHVTALTGPAAAVPEPVTLALMGFSLIGLGLSRRKRVK